MALFTPSSVCCCKNNTPILVAISFAHLSLETTTIFDIVLAFLSVLRVSLSSNSDSLTRSATVKRDANLDLLLSNFLAGTIATIFKIKHFGLFLGYKMRVSLHPPLFSFCYQFQIL